MLLSLSSVSDASTGNLQSPNPKDIEPLMEMQGRVCFGYLKLTKDYLDLYTVSGVDCHKMKYSQLTESHQAIRLNSDKTFQSRWVTIDQPTQRCPFKVFEILKAENPSESGAREIIGYHTQESFDHYRWGKDPKTGELSPEVNLLTCRGYLLEPYEKANLKPEGKRAKPQVSKK